MMHVDNGRPQDQVILFATACLCLEAQGRHAPWHDSSAAPRLLRSSGYERATHCPFLRVADFRATGPLPGCRHEHRRAHPGQDGGPALREGGDLERRALEASAFVGSQAGRLFEVDLCQLLGLSRYEVDGFLKERGIPHDYALADLEREHGTLDRLGFSARAEDRGRYRAAAIRRGPRES